MNKIIGLLVIISVLNSFIAASAWTPVGGSAAMITPTSPTLDPKKYATSNDLPGLRYSWANNRWEYQSDQSKWLPVSSDKVYFDDSGRNLLLDRNNNIYVDGVAKRPDKSSGISTAKSAPGAGDRIANIDGRSYYTDGKGGVYFTDDANCKSGDVCNAYNVDNLQLDELDPRWDAVVPDFLAPGSPCSPGITSNCLGECYITTGTCMGQRDKMNFEANIYINVEGGASTLFRQIITAATFGRELSRLFGWDGSAWERGMTEFFTENVFGQLVSGNWEESLCRADFYKTSNEQGVIITTGGQFYYGLHIQAFRSELAAFYNESTGEWENLAMYMMTYRVQNGNENNNSYNLYFYEAGDAVGVPFFTNQNGAAMDKELSGGESYSVNIDSALLAQSKKVYVKVCIKLRDSIKDYNNDFQNTFCNSIVETTSNEGIRIDKIAGGTGPEFVPVQGQNPGF